MIWAVLPLKDFMNAKQRLSGILAPHERRALFQAMVEDVLAALNKSEAIARIIIVSDDPAADMLAARYDAIMLRETPGEKAGLNAAVQRAADYVIDKGGETMLVIHGDLPLVDPQELQELCAKHRKPGITIAPDRNSQGTNVMLCSPPNVIAFQYGLHSCQLHLQQAERAGVSAQVLPSQSMALDIDSPADLLYLLNVLNESSQPLGTRDYLNTSGLAQRIRVMEIDHDDASALPGELSL
jgi:2-phospho-L-lactate guanylyltransferase